MIAPYNDCPLCELEAGRDRGTVTREQFFAHRHHEPHGRLSFARLTAADIARQSDNLVAAEKRSRDLWARLVDADKAALLYCVRRTLIRLLESPDWLSGSLDTRGGGYLEVRFVVDMSEVADELATEQAEAAATFRHTLEDLARSLREN